MQHSLILAFVSLGELNYEINIMTIINFFHYIYRDRVRCIDAITQLCLKLNSDGNCSVVPPTTYSTSSSSFSWAEFFKKTPTSNRPSSLTSNVGFHSAGGSTQQCPSINGYRVGLYLRCLVSWLW